MKAIIKIDVPDFQIWQEVNIHFKDSMVAKGVVEEENSLPSTSTEKTGHWEEVQFRTIPYNRISKAKKCSVCGKRKDKYVTWNYCPNCGAKMGVEG